MIYLCFSNWRNKTINLWSELTYILHGSDPRWSFTIYHNLENHIFINYAVRWQFLYIPDQIKLVLSYKDILEILIFIFWLILEKSWRATYHNIYAVVKKYYRYYFKVIDFEFSYSKSVIKCQNVVAKIKIKLS